MAHPIPAKMPRNGDGCTRAHPYNLLVFNVLVLSESRI